MSVDHSSSAGRGFSAGASNEALFRNAASRRLGIDTAGVLGDNLLGAYSREEIIAMLADQLAKAPPGSASITGKNGLFRINWFDGRFLTAQAFRQQDSYWDLRLRLLAQIFPPGISWGLGLEGVEATLQAYPPAVGAGAFQRGGGSSLDTGFTLRPGVAFDGLGRPIVVGQELAFCFRDLIPRFQSAPRQVAAGGQRFRSCLCLEPLDGGAGTPGSAVPPGPYLLVIEARECPEGDAKVYGEACAGEAPARCESHGWRGGFGLSLVRFPADPPPDPSIASAWDLRGLLSAYYYDVFEHSLIRRWDPEFARDQAFCEAVGNACQQAVAVPLAMAYLGGDGSILFCDPWIPRRALAATNAATWTRNQLGAPAQSAADARLHQFQCMLEQSLATAPLEVVGQQSGTELNLYQRGFRHIPPVGFLPFDPYTTLKGFGSGIVTDHQVSQGNLFSQIPVMANLAQVQRQIDRYFCGTSVVPYYVVALHDDDLLEDIGNAFHKDPVRVDRLGAVDDRLTRQIAELCEQGEDDGGASFGALFRRSFRAAFAVLRAMAEDTDLLVNRDIEVVKVVIPLQGLRRKHPVVGISDADTSASLADWFSKPPGETAGFFDDLGRNLLVQFLRQRFGMDALPRHFAVYVKQRMVLLDAIYLLFELINEILDFVRTMDTASAFSLAGGVSVQSFRAQQQNLPPVQVAAARAALTTPLVREAVALGAVSASPALASSELWDGFFAEVDAQEARIGGQIADPVLRRQRALDLVTDAQAEETPGFAAISLLVALQEPTAAEASLRSLQRAAVIAPAVSDRGQPGGPTLSRELLHGGGLRVFHNDDSRQLWRAVKSGLSRQPARNLVASAATEAPLGELLAQPVGRAERSLGGGAELEKLRKAVAPKVEKIAGEIDALAADPPSAEVAASFRQHLAAAAGDPVKALAKTQAEFKNDAAATAALKRVKPIADLLGKDGFEPVAEVVFRTG